MTFPGGILQNDLVIVAYAIGDNDNLNFDMAVVTAGYTEVADLFADDTQECNLGVFWKVMGATPDTSVTVDGLGGTDAAVAAVVMIFRGVNTTTPMDVTPTTATAINTMHPNPPSIDHLNPSGLWTVIAGASGHTLAGTGTYTFPTGYTTDAIDRGADDTSDVTVGMGYRTNPADPEDPGVMTHSGTDSTAFAWCATTLALRPAPPATPTRVTASETVLVYNINNRITASEIVLVYQIPSRVIASEMVLNYVAAARVTASEINLVYNVPARVTASEIVIEGDIAAGAEASKFAYTKRRRRLLRFGKGL